LLGRENRLSLDQNNKKVTPRLSQFLRFCVVGAIATGLQYAVLIVGVEKLHAAAPVASAVGFAISACVNYALNYRFTFASEKPHQLAASRFAVVAATGLIINTVLMLILNDAMHLRYLWAQVIATVIVLLWNFFANALWSF
jgi:putative flippase GtrA